MPELLKSKTARFARLFHNMPLFLTTQQLIFDQTRCVSLASSKSLGIEFDETFSLTLLLFSYSYLNFLLLYCRKDLFIKYYYGPLRVRDGLTFQEIILASAVYSLPSHLWILKLFSELRYTPRKKFSHSSYCHCFSN